MTPKPPITQQTITIDDLTALPHFITDLQQTLPRTGLVLLEGELGAGKTTFCRSLINALSSEPIKVPSPSFNICLEYDFGAWQISHYDLYRLSNNSEMQELGLYDDIQNKLVLVEWPERLPNLYQYCDLGIIICFTSDPNQRLLKISSNIIDLAILERHYG